MQRLMVGDPLTLLYVDDEPSMLEVIKDLLESVSSVHLEMCSSVAQAWKLLASHQYDAIISDYQMPGTDGITFLKQVRSKGLDIPFILFTGRGREEIVIDALNNGADFYLQKGPDVKEMAAELLHKIKQAVQQRRDRQALLESERTAWTLLNVRESPCLLIDLDGRIVAVNDFMAHLVGMKSAELVGLSAFDVISPEFRDRGRGIKDRVIASKRPATFLLERYWHTYEFTVYPVIDQKNDVERLALISSDLTEHIRSETELQRRHGLEELVSEVASMLLSATPDTEEAILQSVLDLIGDTLEVDQVHLRLVEDMPERYDRGLVANLQAGGITSEMEDLVLQSNFPWIMERMVRGERVMIDDLSELPVEAFSERRVMSKLQARSFLVLPLLSGGEHIGSLGFLSLRQPRSWSEEDLRLLNLLADIFASIVTRNNLERELVSSNARLRLMQDELQIQLGTVQEGQYLLASYLSNLPGMVYRCHNDLAWTMTYVSPGCFDLLGYAEGDLVSNKISYGSLVHPEDRAKVWDQVQKGLANKEPYRINYRVFTKSGQERWVWEQGHGVLNGQGEVLYLEGLILDVTERRHIEEALRNANRKLNLLSSITRHDILNQITVLNGYIELTKMANKQLELEGNLDRMNKALKRIQDSIGFTKEYEMLGTAEPRWQNVRGEMDQACLSLGLKNIKVTSEVEGLEVFADQMFNRVLANLIDNSLRHGERVSAIRLWYEKDMDNIKLYFEDNGVGVPYDVKEKLFRRGFGKNTGFGLFLSKEILDLTRITITENGEPEKGARFEMNLPKGSYRFI